MMKARRGQVKQGRRDRRQHGRICPGSQGRLYSVFVSPLPSSPEGIDEQDPGQDTCCVDQDVAELAGASGNAALVDLITDSIQGSYQPGRQNRFFVSVNRTKICR